VLVLLAVACQHSLCGAVEPARAFLEGLRARGYYDTALEYLDQMASSPLAPTEFKEALPYERGVTLIAAARTQRDPHSASGSWTRRKPPSANLSNSAAITLKLSKPRASSAI